jgi:hypothetical protein
VVTQSRNVLSNQLIMSESNPYLKSLVPNFVNKEDLDACWKILTSTPKWQLYTTRVTTAGVEMESTFFRYRFNSKGWHFDELDETTWFSGFSEWRDEYPAVFLKIVDQVLSHAGKNYKIWRVGINGTMQGQTGWIHNDADHVRENAYTHLIYMNPSWNPLYGGHTSYYDKNLKEIFTILPEPGKLASYDGNLLHTGHAPNIPNLFRITMTVTGQYM